MRGRGIWAALAGVCILGVGSWGIAAAVRARRSQTRPPSQAVNSASLRLTPGLAPDDALLFNGWGVTPTGEHVILPGDMPLKMIVSPDGKTLAVVTGGFSGTGLALIDIDTRQVVQSAPLAQAWNGLAFSRDGKQLYVGGGSSGLVRAFEFRDGRAVERKSATPDPETPPGFVAGIAVHPATGKLYVCGEAAHQVWVVHPETLQLEASIQVGQHPHSCAFGTDRRHLYVSNWGSRSVSVIDTRSGKRVRDINVGLRPNDLALSPDGRLFVACAGDNTVHVIQTRAVEREDAPADPNRRISEGVREIISTSLYPSSPEGSTPVGVAVSPDGKTLYVANADNNAVLVADIADPAVTQVAGFLPAGWYPTAVAASPNSGTVFIGNGKGLRSKPNFPAALPNPNRLHKPPPYDYIGRTFQGSVSFAPRPEAEALARLTEQVRRNSPYTPESLVRAPIPSAGAIPDRVGAPCPIKYVLYIIKENRTYDQVFGAFKDARGRPAGNGDPNLVMYGEDVAPNHHQLARDYVLLDNLYCSGEVSVDGHSWCDAAISTDYNQRRWIMSYSRHGTLPGNEEMEVPAAGFLWDLCRRHGVSFKCYGEGSNRVPTTNRGTWPGGRDMDRVSGWISDLQAAERSGDLPRFMIMALGEDHTQGTTPGRPTPDAAVGSNDLGLGRIVEAASKSKFWREMAIFVVEDDAQNGPDHVDAHRTVGLVISPWARRGIVDSTLYTNVSMVRTIELILGLPPLTQYDAGATPMFGCFGKSPQSTLYRPLTPKVDLNATNRTTTAFSRESARMDWSDWDRAPEDELNRILWYVKKGPNVPYPAPIHRALFTRR